MGKYWFIVLCALVISGCSSEPVKKVSISDSIRDQLMGNKKENSNSGDHNSDQSAKPIAMSEDDFAVKVFNFRSEKKWKYIGDKPCIVDFYADWCGPCRGIAPILEEIAAEYKDKLYVYKVNTDYAKELCMYFSIDGIPAVMFCPMKGNYNFLVGGQTKGKYVSFIESVLKVNK
jgi:thioredoxin